MVSYPMGYGSACSTQHKSITSRDVDVNPSMVFFFLVVFTVKCVNPVANMNMRIIVISRRV
jgi:hypothetical protein